MTAQEIVYKQGSRGVEYSGLTWDGRRGLMYSPLEWLEAMAGGESEAGSAVPRLALAMGHFAANASRGEN